jgi:hypothetical protein
MTVALDLAQLLPLLALPIILYLHTMPSPGALLASVVVLAIAYNVYAYALRVRGDAPPLWLYAIAYLAAIILAQPALLGWSVAAAVSTLTYAAALLAAEGPRVLSAVPCRLEVAVAVSAILSTVLAILLTGVGEDAPLRLAFIVAGPLAEMVAARSLSLGGVRTVAGSLPSLTLILLLPGYTPILRDSLVLAVYLALVYTAKALLDGKGALTVTVLDYPARLTLMLACHAVIPGFHG